MKKRFNLAVMAAVLLAAAGARVQAGTPTSDYATAQNGAHGVDVPYDLDPPLHDALHDLTFDSRLKQLWVNALDRNEPDMKLYALEAFAMAAPQGMPELEGVLPKIVAALNDAKQILPVRIAAARALVAMDADKKLTDALKLKVKSSGPALLEFSKTAGLESVLVADPALARWKTAGASELWMSRVKEGIAKAGGKGESEQVFRSAIRSLGEIGANEAAEPLRTIVSDTGRDPATRVVAARSLSALGPAAVSPIIDTFVSSQSSQERALAAIMTPVGKDDRFVRVLVTLAQDSEPAVVTESVTKLMKGAPEALAPLAAKLADNKDGAVRRLAVDVLRHHANPQHVVVLAKLLNDDVPHVRVAAREMLIECDALPGLRKVVRDSSKEALAGSGLQAIEQAAFVMAALDEKSARDRLVELITPKTEAETTPQQRLQEHRNRVASIVALRRLAIPDTLEPQFTRAGKIAEQMIGATKAKPGTAQPSPEGADIELAQLLQNLGIGHFTGAEDLMLRMVPKHSGYGLRSRVAAIWALGYLHEGASSKKLSSAFISRLNDTNPLDPEDSMVRTMSAVSLGRMKDAGAKGSLQGIGKSDGGSRLGESATWAVAQIDGEKFVPTPTQVETITGWFLEPVD